MEYKILQIIPAPAGLMAHIANEDKTTTAAPVVCLALIEEKGQGCEPFRYVDYMVGMDEIEAASRIADYVGVQWGGIPG